MKVERLDHYTIRTTPTDLERVRAFYVDVLGLHAGPRPAFRFDGHWLYADDRHPIVHLAVLDPEGGGPSGDALKTGKFDHVAFRTSGLAATRQTLQRHGIAWDERPVPGFPLHQLFLQDPAGIKVELTFDAAELE